MTLIGPVLDDRTFEQLRAELLGRIPVYAPEWTNHNDSDPGIALLDLFAFLGESLLYRFNQIPDATRTAFLRLLDLAPNPPRPAQVLATVSTERPEGVQLLARTGLQAGAVAFETDGELYAWPLEALGAGKVAAPAGTDPAELGRRCDAVVRLGLTSAGLVRFYTTTVLPAEPAAPGAEPLDVAGTVDGALWVALLGGDTTDPALLGGHTVFLGVALDERVDRPFTLATPGGPYRSTGLDQAAPAALWRLWHPPGAGATPGPDDLVPLEIVADTTAGLTTTGVVGLTLPARLPVLPAARPDGDRHSPPPLDDPEVADRVIAWLQATRPASENDAIHRVVWVGANAVEATQASTAAPELLGAGTGEAGQRYQLVHPGVLPGSVQLEVEEAGIWRPWAETADFTGAGPDDRGFVAEPASGEVRFGPGDQQGRVPQIGERIRVLEYRYGGGSAGNVPAGAVNAAPGIAQVDVTNPLPARGGRDAESLDAALERIPAEVHRRDRAVTAGDFRDLAMQVAGVARAETLPLLQPDTPAVPAAGVVSVAVWPVEDTRNPGAPLPDRALLRAVSRHLDPRRLLTTELYVIPPEYRPLAVAAGVVVRDGYQVDAVRRWVELILRQFLAPVPPFGPDGHGWPLGRTVRRAELEAVAVQVDGVEYLEDLRLAVPAGGGGWSDQPLVTLERWMVPELTEITVVEGVPLPPGTADQPAPPADPAGTVLAPLPREVC
jgi:hypothetical protein